LFFSYTPPPPEKDSLLAKYIYMRTNILENENNRSIEDTEKTDQSLFLQNQLVQQNQRIISLLEQLNMYNKLQSEIMDKVMEMKSFENLQQYKTSYEEFFTNIQELQEKINSFELK
jgi:hypothetical protein